MDAGRFSGDQWCCHMQTSRVSQVQSKQFNSFCKSRPHFSYKQVAIIFRRLNADVQISFLHLQQNLESAILLRILHMRSLRTADMQKDADSIFNLEDHDGTLLGVWFI